MHPCDSYFNRCSTWNGKDDPEATERKRVTMRADERREIDAFSRLRDLTADVDRMLVRHMTTPPTTPMGVFTAIQDQTLLIARFDEPTQTSAEATPYASSEVTLRARVLLNGARSVVQGQSADSVCTAPELWKRMTNYLAETTALLDGLPSAILEKLQANGMEAGCRLYHLTDDDLVVTPATSLHAFDIGELLECCAEDLTDADCDNAWKRLDQMKAQRARFLSDPDSLVPLREVLQEIHLEMHQAHLRKHPDVELRLPGPAAPLNRVKRAGEIARWFESHRARLAAMEAFSESSSLRT